MTPRTYRCALTATITVDDETLKSALLGFGLREGLDGPPVDDPDVVFDAQQQMLSAVEHLPAEQLLQMFLVNGYVVPANLAIRNHIMGGLPGSTVEMTGVDVEPLDN